LVPLLAGLKRFSEWCFAEFISYFYPVFFTSLNPLIEDIEMEIYGLDIGIAYSLILGEPTYYKNNAMTLNNNTI